MIYFLKLNGIAVFLLKINIKNPFLTYKEKPYKYKVKTLKRIFIKFFFLNINTF